MITNDGKTIVAKYLLGQAPSYASYISVGCGATPLSVYPTTEPALTQFKNALAAKDRLDFEMFRVPITSRGFVVEDVGGVPVSKIVFTAELPTEERYEISEVGVYSAASNPSASSFDSRILAGFTQSESWQSHVTINGTSNVTPISFISQALDAPLNNNQINPVVTARITNMVANGTTITVTAENNFVPGETVTITNVSPSQFNLSDVKIATATTTQFTIASTVTGTYGLSNTNAQATATVPIFQVNSDNIIFSKDQRASKYERGRYYNNMLVMRGDSSGLFLNADSPFFYIPSVDNAVTQRMLRHVHLSGIKIDLTQNSPLDELRLAFSVLSKVAGVDPERVNVMIEFSNSDSLTGEYARFQGTVTNFTNNRYFVIIKKLQELSKTNGFSWDKVNIMKVYANATNKYTLTYKSRPSGSSVVTLRSSSNHNLNVGDIVSVYDPADSTISGVFTVASINGGNAQEFTITAAGPEILPTTLSDPTKTVEVLNKNFYIAFDGLRLENVTTQNPLYGLVGYSIIKNTEAETIVKNPNSNNYIEYRFNLDVS